MVNDVCNIHNTPQKGKVHNPLDYQILTRLLGLVELIINNIEKIR